MKLDGICHARSWQRNRYSWGSDGSMAMERQGFQSLLLRLKLCKYIVLKHYSVKQQSIHVKGPRKLNKA